MKLLISLLWVTSAWAQVITVSHGPHRQQEAQDIRKMLMENHHIPADFIQTEVSNSPCEEGRDRHLWHLCVDQEGVLQEVSADRWFIRETLGVFL